MTSKSTFTALTNSKSLEIKMTNILSFYEDMVTSIAFKSDLKCFEIIAVEDEIQHKLIAITTESTPIKNVVNFVIPLQRSDDIVDYLIEREQRQSAK